MCLIAITYRSNVICAIYEGITKSLPWEQTLGSVPNLGGGALTLTSDWIIHVSLAMRNSNLPEGTRAHLLSTIDKHLLFLQSGFSASQFNPGASNSTWRVNVSEIRGLLYKGMV